MAAAGLAQSQVANPSGGDLPRTGGEPNWPTSPFHQKRDGYGRIIPCLCRFDGAQYRLDTQLCIMGRMMRCDLVDNVTSWISTGTACSAPAS